MTPRKHSSGLVVRPTIDAPAARSRATATASSGGTKSANAREPRVARSPATQIVSLTATSKSPPATGNSSVNALTRDSQAAIASFTARTLRRVHDDLRAAVRDVCDRFPDAYWRDLDARRDTPRSSSRR